MSEGAKQIGTQFVHSVVAAAARENAETGPRLLVSVRNAAEARQAIEGGCDVLDVKDPSRGPLGMAAAEVIDSIAQVRNEFCVRLPLTVALGELHEWPADRHVPTFAGKIAAFKVGTSQLAGSDWPAILREFRARFESAQAESSGQVSVEWVAVAYADWRSAEGPSPESVFQFAARFGWGLLIDTYSKTRGSLFDHLPVAQLLALRAVARQQGVPFAAAGRLSIGDCCRLREISPDVVGIRSAACRQGRRENEVDATAVREFKAALRAAD